MRLRFAVGAASVLTLSILGLADVARPPGAHAVDAGPSASPGPPADAAASPALARMTPDPSAPGDSGTAGSEAAAVDIRSQIGEWAAPFTWPVIAIHAHLLPDGRVLTWSDGLAYVWNPTDGTFEEMGPTTTNLFCSGHSFLADGRLFVAGGHIPPTGRIGSPDTNIFDPATDTWYSGPQMNDGRWYPTNTTLANGDVLVTAGSIDPSEMNKLPQVWQVGLGTFRNLTSAVRTLPMYPFMFLAPNGKVFYAGPAPKARYLNTSGAGKWTLMPTSAFGNRDYGSAVMYDVGKVLIVGGGGKKAGGPPPTKTAEVIDLNAATPTWRFTNPMNYGRRQLNSTLLPDGKVLVTGGTSWPGFNNAKESVFAAEMWDPATEEWTIMASMQVRRLYHSTALLLPDGRVLSAGGGRPPATGLNPPDENHLDAEIYSPPYLFNSNGLATRPAITGAPASVPYGQPFFVQTPDATQIAKVTWLRLGSVTHAFDQNQRINQLVFSVAPVIPTGLDVTAPANANLAPPGHYMLFLIDGNGVPSVAKIVHIG